MSYLKLIKWVVIVGIILSLISAIALAKHWKNKAEQNAIGRDEAIRIANQFKQETEVYMNKYGKAVLKTRVSEVNLENFRALAKTKELQWLDRFNLLNKKYKTLLSTGSFVTNFDVSQVKRDTVQIPCDSTGIVKAFRFTLKDEWNDIDALVIDSPKVEIRDRYIWLLEWRKKHKFIFKNWRFGEKEWFHHLSNSNKLIKIDSQSVFKISKKN